VLCGRAGQRSRAVATNPDRPQRGSFEIDTFCGVAQIPAMYYEKPYYLAAAKGGDKVYSLLRQALEATDKVAVATFVMHQRQHLCAISPQGKSLMLVTLRFADEILPDAGNSATAKISAAELSMAKQLVQNMQGNFTAGKFKGPYRADLKRRSPRKDTQEGNPLSGSGGAQG
jgi:DNA end-binding protein Ku